MSAAFTVALLFSTQISLALFQPREKSQFIQSIRFYPLWISPSPRYKKSRIHYIYLYLTTPRYPLPQLQDNIFGSHTSHWQNLDPDCWMRYWAHGSQGWSQQFLAGIQLCRMCAMQNAARYCITQHGLQIFDVIKTSNAKIIQSLPWRDYDWSAAPCADQSYHADAYITQLYDNLRRCKIVNEHFGALGKGEDCIFG